MAELLKMLSETNGVSGNENLIREIIVEKIKNDADDVFVDTMGNVIAYKKGKDSSKKIAVTVNMDEPGFILSDITDEGYIKFKAVGNIDPRKIISKKVVIGGNNVKGIIGMKAIHLQTKSEREKVVPVSDLFIDIGAENKSAAEKVVKKGDYITFDIDFDVIGSNVKGKALDRSGVCYALLNAIKGEFPYDVYAFFLVQHEVGARGAKIASHRVSPDVVLTLSSADTTDMYGCDGINSGANLGGGVVINYADRMVIADKRLTDYMAECAEKDGIKHQIKVLKEDGSDSGAMQTATVGRPCLNAVIPCRYSHSPVSLMSMDDILSATEYISLFLNKIGEMI